MSDVDVERFVVELRRGSGLKISRPEYEAAFRRACPEAGEHVDRRTFVANALKELAGRGELRLPVTSSHWDRIGSPPLPAYLTLVAARTRTPAEAIDWLPELAFAYEVKDSEKRRLLAQLNQYLIQHREFEILAPYNERSLEIFGDEKAIGNSLEDGLLFGQVPLERVGAYVPHMPLVHERVPSAAVGAPGLIVENRHSFESFRRWNESRRRYRLIACGDGVAVIRQVEAIGELAYDLDVTLIEYVGDLDPMGVHLGSTLASKLRESPDKVALVPGVPYYRYMLERGPRRVLDTAKRQTCDFAWLGELAEPVQELFSSKRWIPQESVGLQALEHSF